MKIKNPSRYRQLASVVTNSGVPGGITNTGGIRNIQPTSRSVPDNGQVLSPGANDNFPSVAELLSANTQNIPPSFAVTVTSPAAASAVATRVYVFNELAYGLNNAVTSNGSASPITYAYSDGNFAGRVISKSLAQARMGVGYPVYGVTLRVNSTVTPFGGLPASLANANPYFVTWNFFGVGIFLNMNVSANQKRSDTDTSIEGVRSVQNMTAFTQYSFIADASGTSYGTTNQLNFYLNNSFSI